MAFPPLQVEQAGGTVITLHVGLNTHEHLKTKREKATGTEGHSSQNTGVALFGERQRDHARLELQGHTRKVFPSQSHHSALYPLKSTSVFRAQAPKKVGRTGVAI